MILFADLPDEISVYIDEFVKVQEIIDKVKRNEWRKKFNMVIAWIKLPYYSNDILQVEMRKRRRSKFEFKKHFFLFKPGVKQVYLYGYSKTHLSYCTLIMQRQQKGWIA